MLAFVSPVLSGWGQTLPKGAIMQDTVRTGVDFSYVLSYRHPPHEEVFFPDSSFNFSPFTFVAQQIFNTRTDSTGSLDSTVYQFISFEITPAITLSLPVFVWNGKDCTAVYPLTDSALVRLSVDRQGIDTLRFQSAMEIVPVKEQINYSLIVILTGLLGLMGFGIYWIFGEKINRQWRVFRLRRRYRDFTRSFNRHYLNAKNKESIPDVELALVLWKKYLERLEQQPFTTFTTREISDSIPDNSLRFALKDIDEIIYGFTKSRDIGNSLLILDTIAQKLYLQKRKEIITTQ